MLEYAADTWFQGVH